MTRGHLRSRRPLAVQLIPVSFNTLSISATAARKIIEREGAVALLIVPLEVEFWYERRKAG